jgi:hypothetical protein
MRRVGTLYKETVWAACAQETHAREEVLAKGVVCGDEVHARRRGKVGPGRVFTGGGGGGAMVGTCRGKIMPRVSRRGGVNCAHRNNMVQGKDEKRVVTGGRGRDSRESVGVQVLVWAQLGFK